VPEQPVDVLPTADARDLLQVCKGTSFVDRRATAIIILFLGTGMRLSELAGLTVDDLDMETDVAYVLGKSLPATGLPVRRQSRSGARPVPARPHHTHRRRSSRRCGSARRPRAR
jgi:site-specific recombinase XerC